MRSDCENGNMYHTGSAVAGKLDVVLFALSQIARPSFAFASILAQHEGGGNPARVIHSIGDD
jgi:hypothetical protein